MLTFKLISIDHGFYHYEYYPEDDKSKKGTFIFNPKTKEVRENQKADSPFSCFSHFLTGIVDGEGELKKEGFVAWY